MVGDDVEEHVDAARVGGGDEGLHLGVRAEVGVDRGVVDLPVTVVAGADPSRRAVVLHPLVGELRRHPDRGDAEIVEVGQLRREARQIAAVVEAPVGGVEAVDQPIG